MKPFAAALIVIVTGANVSAQEVTFNSIRRGEASVRIGQWMGRDVWAPDRISEVTDPGYPGLSSVYRFVVKPGDKVGGWTGERAEFSGIRTDKGEGGTQGSPTSTSRFCSA